jgi:hypothetical protein
LPTFFIAGTYWVTPGGAAPDHTTCVQVAVLQSVTNVKDGPLSTTGQLQMAFSGWAVSTWHVTSRQFAHGASAGQVMTASAELRSWVENVDTNFDPVGFRFVHGR